MIEGITAGELIYLIALTVSVSGYCYYLINLALTDMEELKRRWNT